LHEKDPFRAIRWMMARISAQSGSIPGSGSFAMKLSYFRL